MFKGCAPCYFQGRISATHQTRGILWSLLEYSLRGAMQVSTYHSTVLRESARCRACFSEVDHSPREAFRGQHPLQVGCDSSVLINIAGLDFQVETSILLIGLSEALPLLVRSSRRLTTAASVYMICNTTKEGMWLSLNLRSRGHQARGAAAFMY